MNHGTFGAEYLAAEDAATRGGYGGGKKYYTWVTISQPDGTELVVWDLQQ